MFGFIGFDPKTLTDDELIERLTEINRRMMWASKYAGSDMVASLYRLREAMEFEHRERLIAPRLQARAALPPVLVETDPDLAKEIKAAQDAEIASKSPKPPPRPNPFRTDPFSIKQDRIKPTSRPTSDTGGK